MEVEQLLRRFEPEKGDQPLVYARSVVEYCSYIALCVETKRHDYLSDSEFHSLTYDMMIAWEAPDDETDAALQVMTPRFSFFFSPPIQHHHLVCCSYATLIRNRYAITENVI